jgi:sortase A
LQHGYGSRDQQVRLGQQRSSVFVSGRVPRHRREPSTSTVTRWIGLGMASAMVALGGWLLVSVGVLEWNFHQVGSDLESQVRSIVAHPAANSTACDDSEGANPTTLVDGYQVAGNLVVPSLSLNAPVVEGIGETQLAVAVGHDPSSVWPSTHGTSVFLAHDVTWFSGINQLRPGSELDYETQCGVYQYLVTSSRVVKAGSPVTSGSQGVLALVTCYPLNALYLTPNRLLVEAELVRVQYRSQAMGEPRSFLVPTVPAPPALASQGLDLAHNDVLLGSLIVTGTPSSSWRQSATPLRVHVALLALYLGALLSAEQSQPSWWQALAPTVAFADAQALIGKSVVGDNGVNATIDVQGSTVVSATIQGTLDVRVGASTVRYSLAMAATVKRDTFEITSWRLVAS